MLETRESGALLATVHSARRKHRDFDAEMQLATRRQMARRNRVAARFQERALRKVLDTAGVDYAEIQKRQAQDATALRKLMGQQRRAANTHAREVSRRSAAEIVALSERMQTPLDWAPETVLLHTAVRIESLMESHSPALPDGSGAISWKIHQLSPFQNIVKGSLRADAHGRLEWAQLALAFDFLWFADRDGTLFAGWHYWPLINRILYVRPGCVGTPSALGAVHGRIGLWSYDASKKVQTMTAPYRDLGHHEVVGPDSSGKLVIEAVDTAQSFPPGLPSPWISITKGKPVVVTVELFAFVDAYGAYAELDFGGAHEINVPLIRLLVG